MNLRFRDIQKLVLKAGIRKKINSELQNLTTPNNRTKYFNEIPLEDIREILKKYDIVLLQEDNTEWHGWLIGENQSTTIMLGDKNSLTDGEFYTSYKNAMLALQWYKRIETGRYEINCYIS